MFSAELIFQELKIVFDFIHQSGATVIAVLDNPARRTGENLQLECATFTNDAEKYGVLG